MEPNLERAQTEAATSAPAQPKEAKHLPADFQPEFAYPYTHQGETVENCHGMLVPDPYRWLEDAYRSETREWVDAQNRLASRYLASIPARDLIKRRVTRLWDYEKYSVPFIEGGQIFYFMNAGLQNQSVLYVARSERDEPRLLLDPNTLSADGTVALSGLSVSKNGRFLAYSLSVAGSDWLEWRVRDIQTGLDLTDEIKYSKFSGASWTHDSQGFFYSRYKAPDESEALQQQNFDQKIYYHRLGTPQSEDRLIYERPDRPQWMLHGEVTEDGRFLVIEARPGTEPVNSLFVRGLEAGENTGPSEPITRPLVCAGDARYDVVGSDGTIFYVMTDNDAPRGRLVAIDLMDPAPQSWREILPQAEEILESVRLVGERFIASYLKDAHTLVRVFSLRGEPRAGIELPGIGSASGFVGKREDMATFYSYTSFNTPPVIYRYDLVRETSEVFRQARIPFNPDDYETYQVFFTSADGTRVPMFLTQRRGLTRVGGSPVLLYGYGGFHASLTPAFSASRLVWMEMGGIYAQVNLRGGGEYGQEWHDAGRRQNKQNVFNDFIAAAEWLVSTGVTSPNKLAIQGGSNGGLLVGACLTQRPDLFGAALPAVGVMDMVRFHKFTIGWAWKSDFGDPDVPEDFNTLIAYSPLHNIRPGTVYPPTLVTTSDHDDRVVPCHSYKFAAALQAAQAGHGPILIRIETQAGHGAGKPTSKVIDEVADQWAFLTQALDMKVPADLA